MLSTNEVAEICGISPNSVRVALTRRSKIENADVHSEDLVIHERDMLRAGFIPTPAQRIGNSSGWERVDVYRWRAYRSGSLLAQRAERVFFDTSSEQVELAMFEVLGYPSDDEFRDALLLRLLAEHEAGASEVSHV